MFTAHGRSIRSCVKCNVHFLTASYRSCLSLRDIRRYLLGMGRSWYNVTTKLSGIDIILIMSYKGLYVHIMFYIF